MVRQIQDCGSWFDVQSIEMDGREAVFKPVWSQKVQRALGRVF